MLLNAGVRGSKLLPARRVLQHNLSRMLLAPGIWSHRGPQVVRGAVGGSGRRRPLSTAPIAIDGPLLQDLRLAAVSKAWETMPQTTEDRFAELSAEEVNEIVYLLARDALQRDQKCDGDKLLLLLDKLREKGFSLGTATYNSVMRALSAKKLWSNAVTVLEAMYADEDAEPDARTFTYLFLTLSYSVQQQKEATKAWQEMKVEGIVPDEACYGAILYVVTAEMHRHFRAQVLDEMEALGISEIDARNALRALQKPSQALPPLPALRAPVQPLALPLGKKIGGTEQQRQQEREQLKSEDLRSLGSSVKGVGVKGKRPAAVATVARRVAAADAAARRATGRAVPFAPGVDVATAAAAKNGGRRSQSPTAATRQVREEQKEEEEEEEVDNEDLALALGMREESEVGGALWQRASAGERGERKERGGEVLWSPRVIDMKRQVDRGDFDLALESFVQQVHHHHEQEEQEEQDGGGVALESALFHQALRACKEGNRPAHCLAVLNLMDDQCVPITAEEQLDAIELLSLSDSATALSLLEEFHTNLVGPMLARGVQSVKEGLTRDGKEAWDLERAYMRRARSPGSQDTAREEKENEEEEEEKKKRKQKKMKMEEEEEEEEDEEEEEQEEEEEKEEEEEEEKLKEEGSEPELISFASSSPSSSLSSSSPSSSTSSLSSSSSSSSSLSDNVPKLPDSVLKEFTEGTHMDEKVLHLLQLLSDQGGSAEGLKGRWSEEELNIYDKGISASVCDDYNRRSTLGAKMCFLLQRIERLGKIVERRERVYRSLSGKVAALNDALKGNREARLILKRDIGDLKHELKEIKDRERSRIQPRDGGKSE